MRLRFTCANCHRCTIEIEREEMETLPCSVCGASSSWITSTCDECDRLNALLNTPELHDFAKAVVLEAAHQRERWGDQQDLEKTPQDWFWTLGYLAGKALAAAVACDRKKLLHHIITSAAMLNNWHRIEVEREQRGEVGPR